MAIADPRVGILFDGWNLLATPHRSPDGKAWRVDLLLRLDEVASDLGLRALDDPVSPVLHFPRSERAEVRADLLLQANEPVVLAFGTLPDGRILRAIIRSDVQ